MSEGSPTSSQFDPLSEIVGLVAGPFAAGIRSIDQLRRAADEVMRGVENFNATMENLNETAARVNRLLNDLEEPVRAVLPQLTRTVRTADDLTQRIVAFPIDVGEFMRAMMDLSGRLAPLVSLAESAGGMFGLRIPGFGRSSVPAPPAAAPPLEPTGEPSAPARKTPARKVSAKRSATTRSAKKSPAKKSPAKKSPAKKSPVRKTTASKRAQVSSDGHG